MLDERAAAEFAGKRRAAQRIERHVEVVAGGTTWVVRPQKLHQGLASHGCFSIEQQELEYRSSFEAAPLMDLTPEDDQLERTQHTSHDIGVGGPGDLGNGWELHRDGGDRKVLDDRDRGRGRACSGWGGRRFVVYRQVGRDDELGRRRSRRRAATTEATQQGARPRDRLIGRRLGPREQREEPSLDLQLGGPLLTGRCFEFGGGLTMGLSGPTELTRCVDTRLERG
jgi:hypothetical protein